MRKVFLIATVVSTVFVSCNSYNNLLKTTNYDYKYEAAKEFYAAGQYTRSYQLLEELVMILKGTDKAQESLFMLGMCYYNLGDYETSTMYFDRYYKTYPKGDYTEEARFYSGKASFMQSPDPRLDQTPTYTAINQLQDFLEFYPYSNKREEVNDMIFQLQNRLVQKEYDSAKLYYNLGSYAGNCANGGSNYEASIITAENALKSYPYTSLREDLYILILRARYQLAVKSVEEKIDERFRETIDEYYGFKNEFPDSKYMKEANQIFRHANAKVNKAV
ncbi:MAG: outer membrane protein assembly factor BamD [Bacteroides sp.]|nr:outer membrane protein assembly factor BamD [Roseburia sp.]MCM1347661.1 outer membrane protein assembly factor BamD [Bacteroides sp.]MCM1422095.1 outer membrane protein assembly factor BamD [Bacteroides sp.]